MKIFLILTLCLLAFLGCDYFTDDTETEPEASPVAPAPANWEALLQDRGNWELLATLKRDVRQDYWHEFYVQPETEAILLQAYIDGKEFLFVIDNPDRNFTRPVQFYFAQPEGLVVVEDRTGNPRSAHTDIYYPSPPTWYTHWGPETNIGGQIKREESGFVAEFNAGFAGWRFQHEDNRAKDWVGGFVEFRATREAGRDTSHKPHIKEGFVLKIFAR